MNDAEQRFDQLLKAMTEGEPPKGKSKNLDTADHKTVDASPPKNHDS